MEALTITTLGHGGGGLAFLDDSALVYAAGCGVVVHDADSGVQRHIWTMPDASSGHPPANASRPVFAVCPGGHLMAYVQQTVQQAVIQVVQQESLLPASTIKDTSRPPEYAALAFSADGVRLLSVGVGPEHLLDVWDVDAKECLIRVPLEDGLLGVAAEFFPLNPDVLVVAGPAAVRLIWAERVVLPGAPGGAAALVRQSEVELTGAVAEGDSLTSLCWTPNGALLLGTALGTILMVPSAAPPALPAEGWGEHPGGGHVAQVLYKPVAGQTEQPRASDQEASGGGLSTLAGTAVVALVPLADELLAVYAGGTSAAPQLLWISPRTLQPLATASLPLHGPVLRAAASPSLSQLAVVAADGIVALCAAAMPAAAAALGSGTVADARAASAVSSAREGAPRHSLSQAPPSPAPRLMGSGASASLLAMPPPVSPHSARAGSITNSQRGVAASFSGTAQRQPSVALPSNHTPRTGGVAQPAGYESLPSPASTPAWDGLAPSSAGPDPMAGAGAGVLHAQASVRLLTRLHAGRVNAAVWLTHQRLITGSDDGSMRLFSYASQAAPASCKPHGCNLPGAALLLEAAWDLGQPITTLTPLLPDDADGSSGGSSAAVALLIGTAGGVLRLVSAQRLTDTDPVAATAIGDAFRNAWDLKVFPGAVSAAALSEDGHFAAACSAAGDLVALFRVMAMGHEASMRLMGMYEVRDPRQLAWAPPPPGDVLPLLVVGSLLGEVLVLKLPDGAAVEALPPSGVLARGSLLYATMRAQSPITALAVAAAAAHGDDAEQAPVASAWRGSASTPHHANGHFYVFTASNDKSMRRFRMPTDQQRAAAAATARAMAEGEAEGNARRSTSGGRPGAGSQQRNVGSAFAATFQTPELERSMELQLPATAMWVSTSSTGQLRVAVASADGSVACYSLPDMSLQGRWLLHELTAGGATAACLMAGELLVTVGAEGSMQVLELASRAKSAASGHPARSGGSFSLGLHAKGSAVAHMPGPPRPKGLERAALGGVVPAYMRGSTGSEAPTAAMWQLASVANAPTWLESRSAAVQQQHEVELAAIRERASGACALWRRRIEELQELNGAADPAERLAPEEFVVDKGMQHALAAQAVERYRGVQAALHKDMASMEVVRRRIQDQCMRTMETPSRPIKGLGDYVFISPLEPGDIKRLAAAKEAAGGGASLEAWSYGLRKRTALEERRSKQVAFLRRVEQGEWETRAPEHRGCIVPLERYSGRMARFSLLGGEGRVSGPGHAPAAAAAAAAPAPPPAAAYPAGNSDEDEDDPSLMDKPLIEKAEDDDNIEGNEISCGVSGLLYADLQLHTAGRKAAQVILIQDEVRALQKLFNERWAEVRQAKQKELDKIDERLGRVGEIQKELTRMAIEEGVGDAPRKLSQRHLPGGMYSFEAAEEGVEGLLAVKDDEVNAAKYVSPEQQARLAADAAAAEAARVNAESDDAKNRALRDMMYANPAPSKAKMGAKEGKGALMQEPWMSLPVAQMSKDQRQRLADFERKVAEAAEEAEKQRRLLEAERRTLELELAEAAIGVNARLVRLIDAKIKIDIEVVHLERQAVEAAAALQALADAQSVRANLTKQLSALTLRRAKRAPMLSALGQAVAAAQRAVDDISASEKQVDKGFRREFGSRPDVFEDANRAYKDRTRPMCDPRVVPRCTPLELLGKSPEGAALQGALEAGQPQQLGPQRSTASVASMSFSAAPAMSRQATTRKFSGSGEGPAGPDMLLTTPRGVVKDLALLARPPQRPGSPIGTFAQSHLGNRPVVVLEEHMRTGMGSPVPRARAHADVPNAERADRSGAGGGRTMQRLRALAERGPLPLDPLLQMVADGFPATSLAAELGPLGLGLLHDEPHAAHSSAADASVAGSSEAAGNPFTAHAARRVFDPHATGVADALDGATKAAAKGGAFALGGARNSGSVSQPGSAAGQGAASGTSGPGVGPFDAEHRPEGMDEALWLRVLEFRDTRLQLEKDALVAWRRLCLLSAQLDWLEIEDADMEWQVEMAGTRAAALRDGALRTAADVSLTYRLLNGQVEVFESRGEDAISAGGVLGRELAGATLLHRNHVEAVNEELLSRGQAKVEDLHQQTKICGTIHLTRWEVDAADLRTQHATHSLTELQLLHVTKDLQAALRDPSTLDKLQDEGRLADMAQVGARLHAHRIMLRRQHLGALGGKLVRGAQEQGELVQAEGMAAATYKESQRVHMVMLSSQAAEDAAQRRHMRNVVTNAQLRDIAQQQALDLRKLLGQLQDMHNRNFPALLGVAPDWAPPDYQYPPAAQPTMPAASRGVAAGAAAAAAAHASRPPTAARTSPSHAGAGGGKGASVGRAVTPTRGAAKPVPPASPPPFPGAFGSRPGSAVRSGGAGATLSRPASGTAAAASRQASGTRRG